MNSPAIPAALMAAPIDDSLLCRYAEQMAADHVQPRKHGAMFSVAVQFLQWWCARFDGDEFCISAAAGNWPHSEEQWMDLREMFLCHYCPDHDLRTEFRSDLNRFLRFLAAPAANPKPPIPASTS